MESVESTYGPLVLHEKSYLFFPSGKFYIIKRNNRKLSSLRRAQDSSTMDKLSMMSMRKGSWLNLINM